MDRKALILQGAARRGQAVSFGPPATEAELAGVEAEFGVRLPAAYRELMLQANGVFDEYDCPLLDDLVGVRAMNRDARSGSHEGYMPLDDLFFISSAYGNGDLVGYGIRADGAEPALFRWDHEDDSRTVESPDLETWVRGVMGG